MENKQQICCVCFYINPTDHEDLLFYMGKWLCPNCFKRFEEQKKLKKKIQFVLIRYDNGEETGFGFHYSDMSDFRQRMAHRDLIIRFLMEYSVGKFKVEKKGK